MAKKTTAPRKRAAKKPTAPVSTAELEGDPLNPRKIDDNAAGGLSASIDKFGDLSGIVFNLRTGQLVAGHQRMSRIRAQYGDREIRVVDEANGLGLIEIEPGKAFSVRVVDWSKAKQRAANVAANNQKIAGTFTEDLAAYMLDVEADLAVELPGAINELLLADLYVPHDIEGKQKHVEISESYQVIVQCTDEPHQRKIYERLAAEGLPCKLLTI